MSIEGFLTSCIISETRQRHTGQTSSLLCCQFTATPIAHYTVPVIVFQIPAVLNRLPSVSSGWVRYGFKGSNYSVMGGRDSAPIAIDTHTTFTANPTRILEIPVGLTFAARIVLIVDADLLKLCHHTTSVLFTLRNTTLERAVPQIEFQRQRTLVKCPYGQSESAIADTSAKRTFLLHGPEVLAQNRRGIPPTAPSGAVSSQFSATHQGGYRKGKEVEMEKVCACRKLANGIPSADR